MFIFYDTGIQFYKLISSNANLNKSHRQIESMLAREKKTRPDTRPIPVVDGWAWAKMRVSALSSSITTDRQTDQWTDGRTDKASYRVASPQLKIDPIHLSFGDSGR